MAAGVRPVTRSANEAMVLATKAARGAGAPPAQAAQFGAAAVGHLSAGMDVSVLDAALDALPHGVILELPVAIVQMVEQAQAERYCGPLPVAVSPLVPSYLATLPFAAGIDGQGTVTLDLNEPSARKMPARIDLQEQTYDRWSALAARLLVPESDASRLSGAGAGLTDND